jgi:hypothetical protein
MDGLLWTAVAMFAWPFVLAAVVLIVAIARSPGGRTARGKALMAATVLMVGILIWAGLNLTSFF